MIDRDAALKTAEKLIRQGRLDAAIVEFVRLVEDQPRDWNAINVLGDLYARVGDRDRAVAQFTKIADHLHAEGFFAKAAALYKKALKLKADDEYTLWQLADVASKQRLVVDAKQYLRQLADLRRARGDSAGAVECLVRLARLEDEDSDATIANTNDPDLLLALAHRQLAMHQTDAGVTLTRVLAIAPERYPAVVRIAHDLLAAGQRDTAYACIDVAVDAALLDCQFGRAAALLEDFLKQGLHAPALRKLIDVCRDAGFDRQRAKAEAELHAMHTAEARVRTATDAEQASEPIDPLDLDGVFEQMRARARQSPETRSAAAEYDLGLQKIQRGDVDAAIEHLEMAARAPLFRFNASAQLGRLYSDRGDLVRAVDWLERAAEAPAPTTEAGVSLLYDLAATLERMNETARALAVLIEIEADEPGYRDVRDRIAELSRTQARSAAR